MEERDLHISEPKWLTHVRVVGPEKYNQHGIIAEVRMREAPRKSWKLNWVLQDEKHSPGGRVGRALCSGGTLGGQKLIDIFNRAKKQKCLRHGDVFASTVTLAKT